MLRDLYTGNNSGKRCDTSEQKISGNSLGVEMCDNSQQQATTAGNNDSGEEERSNLQNAPFVRVLNTRIVNKKKLEPKNR